MQRALGVLQQQLSQLASLVVPSRIMRPKRTRQATKQHQENEYVDLDSDEFEQALAGDEVAAARPRKRQKEGNSSAALKRHAKQPEQEESAAAAAKAEEPAAAAAVVDLLDDTDEQEEASEQEEEELDELVECSEDPVLQDLPSDSAAGSYSGSESDSDSDSNSSGSEYDEDGEAEAAVAASNQRSKQLKQQQKGKQKQKKPRKKRLSTRRLCASYAKAQYRLTDADLKQLKDVKYEPNPHYPGGYPMKLYLVRELEELARAKQERKAQLAEGKEERAAARTLEAKARKVAAAAAAAEAAQRFEFHAPIEERHGSLQLPDTCLANIMACLASTMQPGGLRGPSCVAKELAQASLVCWDFYHAAKHGFQALAQATDSLQQRPPPEHVQSRLLHGLASLPGPAALGGWALWDSVVQQPTSLKLPQLKDAARQLGVMVTGTKAELVLRLLGAFGVQAPTKAPAQLLRALLLERSNAYDAWDGPDCAVLYMSVMSCIAPCSAAFAGQSAVRDAKSCNGVAGMRAAILEAGYASLTDFKAAGKAAQVAEDKRRREEAAQYAAERAAREAARRAAQRHQQQQQQQKCACGKTAAAACERRCCGHCCKQAGGCHRHKVGFRQITNRDTAAAMSLAMSWFAGMGSGQF